MVDNMPEIIISSQKTLEIEANSESLSSKNFYENEFSQEYNKRKSPIDNEYCTGCILLNLSFKGFQFNKVIEAESESVDQTMKKIKENMKILDTYVENFKSLIEERLMSVSSLSNGSKHNSENMKLESDYALLSLQNDQKFKHPKAELSQNLKNRLTSSSSSSNRPSSSIINRYSTASSNSISVTSEYAMKTDSEEPISETSDSEQEQLAVTIIEQEEESEYINIYAKWKTDKYYYSGKVKDISSTENWEVLFDDGTLEMVKRTDTLQLNLLPEGTEVSVDIEGDGNFLRNFSIYEHVDVKANYRKKPEKGYRVLNKLTGQYYTVTRDRVGIHSGVVRKLISMFGDVNISLTENPESGNVSIGNIITEKRALKRKRFSQYITLDDIKPKRCPSPSIFNMSTPRQLKSNISNLKSHVPKTESSLFTNCFFMITGGKCVDDDTENDLFKIEKIIYKHNGSVIEQPTQVHIEKYKNNKCKLILVVLGDVSQTVKFMMSLAIGQVPIVHEKWIHESIQQTEFLDYESFLLFRGIDDDGHKIPINLINKNQPGIFTNKNILIVTDSVLTFGKNWQYILELAGAQTFLMDTLFITPCISSDYCHFAVVDKDGITNNAMKKLKNLNIIVVNILYVTRCLILNELIAYGDFIL